MGWYVENAGQRGTRTVKRLRNAVLDYKSNAFNIVNIIKTVFVRKCVFSWVLKLTLITCSRNSVVVISTNHRSTLNALHIVKEFRILFNLGFCLLFVVDDYGLDVV